MAISPSFRWLLLAAASAALAGVLGFYGIGVAAPQAGQPPFASSVEQRAEMIRELREIKELIKEQNSLLRGLTRPNEKPIR
jgi:hypothetical protein